MTTTQATTVDSSTVGGMADDDTVPCTEHCRCYQCTGTWATYRDRGYPYLLFRPLIDGPATLSRLIGHREYWTTQGDVLHGEPSCGHTLRSHPQGSRWELDEPGHLPRAWREWFVGSDNQQRQVPGYMIRWYDTPLAWHVGGHWRHCTYTGGTWYMPQVHYSGTATRYQKMIRTALADVQWVTRVPRPSAPAT
jgi:hypothetical protein